MTPKQETTSGMGEGPQGKGASSSDDRAVVNGAGQAVSTAEAASIPCAEQFCGTGGEHFFCGCITEHVREIMRYWTKTNYTFADDDVTALGILAGHAMRAGLHHDAAIPASLRTAIDAAFHEQSQ